MAARWIGGGVLAWLAAVLSAIAALPEPGASSDWSSRVAASIQAEEYYLSPARADGGWTAPNRAQDLRGRWDFGALSLTSRVDGDAWSFRYELAGIGRGSSTRVSDVTFEEVVEGRIEWQRGEAVREWYVNDARGIEQGFILDERPPGDAAQPIAIDGRIDGLLAYPAEDGQSVLLRTPAGVDALRIRDLVVRDATGAELNACLDVSPGMLSILVDDTGATYPITSIR